MVTLEGDGVTLPLTSVFTMQPSGKSTLFNRAALKEFPLEKLMSPPQGDCEVVGPRKPGLDFTDLYIFGAWLRLGNQKNAACRYPVSVHSS